MLPILAMLMFACIPGGDGGSTTSGSDDEGGSSSSASDHSSGGSEDHGSDDGGSSGSDDGGSEAKPQLVRPGKISGPPEPDKAISRGDCDAMADGGPVNGPDCVTDWIECDSTVIGHTRGGVDRFNTRFWEKNFCWPGTVNHNSGDERVYRLSFDKPRMRAHVTLDSPCADLDMMAFNWSKTECPTLDHSISRCESGLKEGFKREKTLIVSQEVEDWLIVVEGSGDNEGAFALTVQCEEW